jgi:hypothetical protein
MDKSKEYILMCEKAEEIQEEWKPITGDVYDGRSNITKGIHILKQPECLNRYKWDHIWLPRQDQLQDIYINYRHEKYSEEIKKDYGENDGEYLNKIYEAKKMKRWVMNSLMHFKYFCESPCPFSEYKDSANWKKYDTYEQLWLAFVMKEKYNKKWNGKEWIKQS